MGYKFDLGCIYKPINFYDCGLMFERIPTDTSKTYQTYRFEIEDSKTGYRVPWIPQINDVEYYSEYECISEKPLVLKGKLVRDDWYEHSYDYLSRNLNKLGANTSPSDVEYLMTDLFKDNAPAPTAHTLLSSMIGYFNTFYSKVNDTYRITKVNDKRGRRIATMLLSFQDACIIDYLNRESQGSIKWSAYFDSGVIKVVTYDGTPYEEILKQCSPGAIPLEVRSQGLMKAVSKANPGTGFN